MGRSSGLVMFVFRADTSRNDGKVFIGFIDEQSFELPINGSGKCFGIGNEEECLSGRQVDEVVESLVDWMATGDSLFDQSEHFPRSMP